MQRRITIVLLLIWAVTLALPVLSYRIASAVELPPAGSSFYIQTSSPTRSLSIGDWYTNLAGGNGYHYITLHVPCNWNPNIPVHIDLFHPDLNGTAGSGVTDEFGGTINASYTTTFEVYAVGTPLNPPTQPAPGAAGSLIQQTYNPNTIGPQWTRLYTIAAPVTCGAYILRTQTGGNADNSWRLRFGTDDDNNPATLPPANYDNPDGIEGTGDELLIGLASTSYQHDNTTVQCLTLRQYITPGQASVTFNNFDMDGQTRVRYYAPSAAYDPNALTGGIAGTLSSNAVWNNGVATVRGGDTITNPEPGWWRIVTCINRNNQFIQEGQTNLLSFIELPPEPDMTIAKDDGVSVTAPGQTLTYQIQFSNQSNLTRVPPNARPGAAFNVVITDAIPSQTTFVGCSMNGLNGSCSASGGVVTFTLTDPLAAGASGTVLVTVQVNVGATGSITNTATLNYRDQLGNQYPPVSASDTNTIPPQPLMALSKTDGSTVTAPGQTLTYTLVFTNTGVGEARNVTLTDTLPAGVSYQSCALGTLAGTCSASSGVVTFTLTDPVAAGASGSVSATVLVTASGPATLTNTATLNYTDSAGQNLPPVSASDSTVIPDNATVRLTKSAAIFVDGNNDGLAGAGDVIEYTLILTNTGPAVARQIVVFDTPDTNTTLVIGSVTATPPAVVTQGNSAGDTAVQVTLSSLDVNANLTITFRVQVNTPLPNNVTEIVNQATASGDNTPTTSSDDPTTTTPDDPTRLRTPPPEAPPTAIELTEFRLLPVTGGWEIRWTTGVEVNTSVFMIYRSTSGRDKASLLAVIPARGSAGNGASYSVIDRSAPAGFDYSYWLVEIETNGAQHEYGPLQSRGTISQQHQYFIPLIGR
ncbi:hypothetical protein [Chloroflexus sp.]|uniref:hypothetical protein n=1 Tax=Chloroflexus sp. TaxID=1904827 RepID=UPI002ACE5E3C|nr:hypothetical protein [Chloroflexus sp.]